MEILRYLNLLLYAVSFPGGSGDKSICLQCRRQGFDPWVGKIPWRRKWQPTPVLLPEKFHGWRSLVGYSPWLLLLSLFSRVRPCATPEMTAHQAPLSWDSPGKNTGVGCHFLLQCMKVKSEREVAQSCLTLPELLGIIKNYSIINAKMDS